jgi:diguanylate cyclase (GGDEF)-like protein
MGSTQNLVLALSSLGLLSMLSAATIGRWRRRQWVYATHALENGGGAITRNQIIRTQRSQRALYFLDGMLRRMYYVITGFSILWGITLLFTALGSGERLRLWVVNTATIWVGALVLIVYWRGWDDEHERYMRRKLQQAQEKMLEKQGIVVYDKLASTYTPDFWLRILDLHSRQTFPGVKPITYLVIRVGGLSELRYRQGDKVADQVLSRIGQEIKRNVRNSDLACRCSEETFVVALLRCPVKYGWTIGERVTANLTYLVLDWVFCTYGCRLSLRHEHAGLLGNVSTPSQLLHAIDKVDSESGRYVSLMKLDELDRQPAV